MIYLFIAIITSTLIIVTFRILKHFNIEIVQAISVNYLVASSFGFLIAPENFSIDTIVSSNWFPYAILVGLTLIIAFNFFALSAQKAGVTVTAISSRMSVVIPVILGFILFGDKCNLIKITGIVLALIAFYLTFKKKENINFQKKLFVLPLLLFLAVGTNDSLMKFTEHFYIEGDFVLFLSTAFFFALIFGLLVLGFKIKKQKFAVKNIIAGFILGLLNWWSTLYFLKGLDVFEVSVFIPIYNVSVVALSAIIGFFLFKEKLRFINWLGILMAIGAITMISLS